MAEQDVFIIKRIKKGGHDHHGGAWKVAYADFVTAMMAFFLLLWLLSATSENQKEGIADYFTPDDAKSGTQEGAGAEVFAPTFGLKDSMGIGFKGGQQPVPEGIKKQNLTPPAIVVGKMPQGPIPKTPEKDSMVEAEQDSKLFEKAEKTIKQAIESDPNLRDLKDNIIVEQSPEGLKIQLADNDKHPMFEAGGALLTEWGRTLLSKMIPVIQVMPNYISITGHTDSGNFTQMAGYTNWELSADRANSARKYLMSQKLEPERVRKIVAMGDKELLTPDDPASPRNRRISIILLRGAYLNLTDSEQSAPRSFLSVPKIADDTLKARPVEKKVAPKPVVPKAEPQPDPNIPVPEMKVDPRTTTTPDASNVPEAPPSQAPSTPRATPLVPSGLIDEENKPKTTTFPAADPAAPGTTPAPAN